MPGPRALRLNSAGWARLGQGLRTFLECDEGTWYLNRTGAKLTGAVLDGTRVAFAMMASMSF